MPKFKITDKELKYIAYGLAVIYIWFGVIKDAIAPYLQNMWIPLAAFVFDLGLLVGLYYMSKPLNGGTAFRFSLAGYSLFSGIDLLEAPFMVTKAGTYITSGDFWFASKDVAVAELWKTLGVSSTNLYFFTYVIGGVLLILVIPALLTNEKRILKALR